jgi:protein-tyrosine phosphatase
MIDLHCHLMPGIDDGAVSLDVSLQMLEEAAASNISAVCVTPHYSDEMTCLEYDRRFRMLVKQTLLQPIRLLRGMEYKYSDLLNLDEFVTLGGSSYLLVDFVAPAIDLRNVEKHVLELKRKGYQVLAAHPERLFDLRDIPALKQLARRGVVMQLNTGSFIGIHGDEVKKMAEAMLRCGLCHVIASDSHGKPNRKLFVDEAMNYFSLNYGNEVIQTLFHDNSRLIIDGKVPDPVMPSVSLSPFEHIRRLFVGA